MHGGRGVKRSGKEVLTLRGGRGCLINPLGGNRGHTVTVKVTKEVVSASSRGKFLPGDCERALGGGNLVFVCLYSALPEEVSHLLWNSRSSQGCQTKRRKICE